MKRNKFKIKQLLSIVLFLGSFPLFSQNVQILNEDKPHLECVTEEDYQQYLKPVIEKNIQRLREEGKIKPASEAKMGGEVKFAFPLKMADNYKEIDGVYDGWYVGNFADLDHDEYDRLDWNCFVGSAAKNYDQHNGADIVPYPFYWQMMDDESIDIIAAADGEVIHLYDGNTIDRNCATPHSFNSEPFNGGYYGNFVALLHDDLSITVYAHMKIGTMADLEEGDYVVQGQYLGKLGSSGNSSAPHLHFEFRPCETCQYDEPWYDPEGCNDDLTESRWISQTPYYDPQVLRVATHNALPVFKDCADYEGGSNETVNFSNHFTTAEVLMITVSMRDFFVGDDLDVDIISSAGLVLEDMDWVSADNYYNEIFMFTTSLAGYATGTYKIRVTHDGVSYNHFFTVNCPSALTLSGSHTGVKGYISGDYIASTATISGVSTNDVLYQGENYVKLNVGFQATLNSGFLAQVDDCTIGGLKTLDEEIMTYNELNVFPNPSDGVFTVYFESEDFTEKYFIVRNLIGEIIYTSETFYDANKIAEVVRLDAQPKGVYLVELHANNKIESKKIILQ